MRWHDVEFRLLQVVLNQVGDERRTLVLLHWDGQELRVARAKPPALRSVVRGPNAKAVRLVVDGLLSALRDLLRVQPLQAKGLDEVYRVPEGAGSYLAWGPLRYGRTSRPRAHFEELVQLLDLEVLEHGYTRLVELTPPLSPKSVTAQLHGLGQRLREELGDAERVRTDWVVHGLREYKSPLSWLNGSWHHSFPLDLSRGTADDKLERTLGRIDLSIPRDSVGVIVAIFADTNELRGRLERVEEYLAAAMEGRVEMIRAPMVDDDGLVLDALADRVKRDVRPLDHVTLLPADEGPRMMAVRIHDED